MSSGISGSTPNYNANEAQAAYAQQQEEQQHGLDTWVQDSLPLAPPSSVSESPPPPLDPEPAWSVLGATLNTETGTVTYAEKKC